MSMFDWKRPRLQDIQAQASEKAQIIALLLVNNVLVPLVTQGKERADVLKLLCEKLPKSLEVPNNTNHLLQATIADLQAMAQFLLILLSPCQGEIDIKVLDNIMTSKRGNKALLRQAVMQTAMYKTAEIAVRKMDLSSRTMGPRLRECLETLRCDPSWASLRDCLNELPKWQDNLPTGVLVTHQ